MKNKKRKSDRKGREECCGQLLNSFSRSKRGRENICPIVNALYFSLLSSALVVIGAGHLLSLHLIGVEAAPRTLMSRLASAAATSTTGSSLVKSARFASYSVTCPSAASIHPCTCLYHSPGSLIEEDEVQEEVFEISPALTTPTDWITKNTRTPTPTTLPPSTTTTTTTTPTTTTTSDATDPPTSRSTSSTVLQPTTTTHPTSSSQPPETTTGGPSSQALSEKQDSITTSLPPIEEPNTQEAPVEEWTLKVELANNTTSLADEQTGSNSSTAQPANSVAPDDDTTAIVELTPTTKASLVSHEFTGNTTDTDNKHDYDHPTSLPLNYAKEEAAALVLLTTETTTKSPPNQPITTTNVTGSPLVSQQQMSITTATSATPSSLQMPSLVVNETLADVGSPTGQQLAATTTTLEPTSTTTASLPIATKQQEVILEGTPPNNQSPDFSINSGTSLVPTEVNSTGNMTNSTDEQIVASSTTTMATTTSPPLVVDHQLTNAALEQARFTTSAVLLQSTVTTNTVPANPTPASTTTTTELKEEVATSLDGTSAIQSSTLEPHSTNLSIYQTTTISPAVVQATDRPTVSPQALDNPSIVSRPVHEAMYTTLAQPETSQAQTTTTTTTILPSTGTSQLTTTASSVSSSIASTPINKVTGATSFFNSTTTARPSSSTNPPHWPIENSAASASPAKMNDVTETSMPLSSLPTTKPRPPTTGAITHTSGSQTPSNVRSRLIPNSFSRQQLLTPVGRVRMEQPTVTGASVSGTTTTDSSGPSQRLPNARRHTRFLTDNYLAEATSGGGTDSGEVVAYCRNVQNPTVLREAIKGFRGHQVSYFVIDSCRLPPFPNDLFQGIDVRWLEMSNSTVQFHDNFLHPSHGRLHRSVAA